MDWFEKLTGFREGTYETTKRRLKADGEYLHVEGSSPPRRIGRLELLSLSELRSRLAARPCDGELKFGEIHGDARSLHRASENRGSLFQVASQFNLLEMVSPAVTPEDGVTRYQWDRTQGPACAIAAGAATLYRNYLVPVGDQSGQTAACQIDALADIRELLAHRVGVRPNELWTMSNGYPMANETSLRAICNWLDAADELVRDEVRGQLRIGVHWNVEVTDEPEVSGSLVSQAFCSAIPVSYSRFSASHWEPLARLILEAAYEGTFAAAVLNALSGNSAKLYLTRLGGGAFGNPKSWIDDAIGRACRLFASYLRDFIAGIEAFWAEVDQFTDVHRKPHKN